MTENMELEKKWGYIAMGNKFYEIKSRSGKPTFIEVPIKKIKEQQKLAGKIAAKLKDSVDGEKILMEQFMHFKMKTLEQLEKIVFSEKRKYKAKTRSHHCVDMKVGNFIIPLVD